MCRRRLQERSLAALGMTTSYLCLLALDEFWGDGVVELDGDYGFYASVGIDEADGGGCGVEGLGDYYAAVGRERCGGPQAAAKT